MKIYVNSAATWRDAYDLASDLSHILFMKYDDSVSVDEQISAKSAADALVWYMNTGRAYRDFELALKKAKLDKILAFMIKDSRCSNDFNDLLKSAKKYLIRYCGMPRE